MAQADFDEPPAPSMPEPPAPLFPDATEENLRNDFVFRSNEEMTAFASQLPHDMPPEELYLDEIEREAKKQLSAPVHEQARARPTKAPTTRRPTADPTAPIPTADPTEKPSRRPTKVPTTAPTRTPTREPTPRLTGAPTFVPTRRPTRTPTAVPSRQPVASPTMRPTRTPTAAPSLGPVVPPTVAPTRRKTRAPTPTRAPTRAPTAMPSRVPTMPSSGTLTAVPSLVATLPPTAAESSSRPPTRAPTVRPTANPTPVPPVAAPTAPPVTNPTAAPTAGAPTVSFPQAVWSLDAAYFTGANSLFYASLPDPPGAVLSLSVWLNTTTPSAYIASLARTPSNYDTEHVLSLDASGRLTYFDYGGGGYGFSFTGAARVTRGVRTHVVFVKNATTAQLYVNGVLDKAATASRVVVPLNVGWSVGRDARDNKSFFVGSMDHLRLYKRALTAAEVRDLYFYFVQPPTAAPTTPPTAAPTRPTAVPTAAPTVAPSVMPPTVAVNVAGANRAPTVGFQIVAALPTGDASNVTGAVLRDTFARLYDEVAAQRTALLTTLLRNASNGALLTNLTWALTGNSMSFTVADGGNTFPLFTSNFNFGASAAGPVPLATVGFYPTDSAIGRTAAFGVNPFRVPFTAFTPIMRNLVAWLRGGDGGGGDGGGDGGGGIVLAHLPGAGSYFNEDGLVRSWFVRQYPAASINAVNACDNAALDTCLFGASIVANAKLLVIGGQIDRAEDSAQPANTKTDVAQVTAAVARFLAAGGSVMYLHFNWKATALGAALTPLLGVQPLAAADTAGNYFAQAGMRNCNPLADRGAASLAAVRALVATLSKTQSLEAADVCSEGAWIDCATAGFTAKVKAGALALRSVLNTLDGSGVALFSDTTRHQFVFEKLLVLLGDKYRAAAGAQDPSTPVVRYPLARGDLAGLAEFAFADASVLYRRAQQPAQSDLGTAYCSARNTLLGPDGCAPYRQYAATLPRLRDVVVEDAGVYSANVWTATGVFAVPGVPFTVRVPPLPRRGDVASVSLFLWYQRPGTTKSLETSARDATKTQYARPQWLKSPAILLTANATRGSAGEVTVTSPYGGPVYLALTYASGALPRPADAGAVYPPVRLVFNNVARHAALLDVGNATQVARFLRAVRSSPIPVLDLKAPGMELHMRSDFFLAALRPVGLFQNYSGPGGLAQILHDLRYNFLEAQMTLAGFKAPGKALAESLSPQVLRACAALRWNCTDEAIHVYAGIQHAVYDDRALCGNGCSGNPFDMDWTLTPMGWGEAHELGHNMQMSQLQVAWLAAGSSRDAWANYANRATENSNNLFPYHNRWRYFRVYRNFSGSTAAEAWKGHVDDFTYLQSALARVNATVGGVRRAVVLKADCSVQSSYPLGTPVRRVAQDAVYASAAYAADNDARMAFYLQLTFLMTQKPVVSPALNARAHSVVLHSGFDVVTLLYQGARFLKYYAQTDALWTKHRASIGFGLFNRTCTAATCGALYGSGSGATVAAMPGNDFLLVLLSFLSGYDFRPFYDVRGLQYSSLAERQVLAHVAAGVVFRGPVPTDYYAIDDFPPADLVGGRVVKLPLDGVTAWPFTARPWTPAGCNLA